MRSGLGAAPKGRRRNSLLHLLIIPPGLHNDVIGIGRCLEPCDCLLTLVDEDETTLESDAMLFQVSVHGLVILPGELLLNGWRRGQGRGFCPGIGGSILLQFNSNAAGLCAHLRDGLREPAVYCAVHQDIAKEEKEERRSEGEKESADQHAGADARAEHPAALIGIHLQDGPEQQDEEREQHQKNESRQTGKEEELAGGAREKERQVEGVEGSEDEDESRETAGHPTNPPPAMSGTHHPCSQTACIIEPAPALTVLFRWRGEIRRIKAISDTSFREKNSRNGLCSGGILSVL